MLVIILVLLLAVAAGIVGFAVEALAWMLAVALALLLVGAIAGFTLSRRRGTTTV